MGTITKNLASDILVRRGRNSEMSELLNEVAATNQLGKIELNVRENFRKFNTVYICTVFDI